ncbi:MAG: dihydrofolate reductase [Pseudomonadota bacterium]
MLSSVKLSLIVARAKNGVIGVNGKLPWHLSDDLKFFKQATTDHPIIMGRRTWESLPFKPLPRRENIVLTHDWTFEADGARVFSALAPAIGAGKALARSAGKSEVFIIGGQSLYKSALPSADLLYLTEVDVTLDGDAYFPDVDENQFEEITRRNVSAGHGNDYNFTLRVLKRLA